MRFRTPIYRHPRWPALLLMGWLVPTMGLLAQTPQIGWLSVAQASAQSNVEKAWTDPHGNTLMLVSTGAGTTMFGNVTLNHEGYAIVKADATGTWQWARPLPTVVWASPGQSQLQFLQMAGDYQGGFYLTGRLLGTATFAPGVTVTSIGFSDAVIAHYDSTGAFDWVRHVGSPYRQGSASNQLGFESLTTDAQGNAYVTGGIGDTLVIGTTRLVPSNLHGRDLVVAKINRQGSWQWATQSTGPADETGLSLTTDGRARLYVAGGLTAYRSLWLAAAGDTISQFGTTQLHTPLVWVGSSIPLPASEGFVAQLDMTSGQWQWAVQTRGFGSASGFSQVLVGSTGHVYAVGSCFQSRFGPFTPPDGTVVARLSPTGAWEWVTPGPQAPDLWVLDAGLNPRTEEVMFTGTFKDSLAIGPLRIGLDSLSDRTGSDRLFVAALDSSGHASWALASSNDGGYHPVFGISIGADAQGTVYLAGHYTRQLYLGPFALNNTVPNSGALFLARIGVGSTTGLPEAGAAASGTLFPNPVAAGTVSWHLPTPPSGSVEIVNALGQVVRRIATPGTPIQIPTSDLPAGIYLLRTETPAGLMTQRLVKE